MYAIYLVNDTEKWFNIHFSNESRAHWYAEASGLEPSEYEVRPKGSLPTIQTQVEVAPVVETQQEAA